jgi:outer membrane lipoprotein YfiO
MSEGTVVAANSAGSLSRRERGGVRGYKLSVDPNPLTPTLSPAGRGSPAVPWLDSVCTRKVFRALFVSLFVVVTLALPEHAGAETVPDPAVEAEAGKNMLIGGYYVERGDHTGALARFKTVVTRYRSSQRVAEALARLTKVYLALGVPSEAQTAAAVLAREFPNNPWTAEAENALRSAGLKPHEKP